jgi:SRSO17 transposase
MIHGLLSDLKSKSIEPICHAFLGAKKFRNLANFMTESTWDDVGMLDEYNKEIGQLLSHPLGMITGDGCDFPKKGKMSAGVARQHCGPLGKVDNCQASVMVGYASPEGYGLADCSLYIPDKWFTDDFAERRAKCRIPEDLEFKTKNQMLSELINKRYLSGDFKGKYVGVDAGFGHDQAFLDSLPKGLVYFADVHSTCKVFTSPPEMILKEYSGRGRKPSIPVPSIPPVSVKEIAEDDSIPWNNVVLGIGSKGPIITRDKCIKVVESLDNKPGKEVWLYMRRLEDESVKFSLCNESMDATVEDIRIPALMRWTIEQSFHECKDYLGMDHYELRTWHGWKRHMLLVFIAHLFVIKLRRKFSVHTDIPTPVPVIDSPVILEDYVDAFVNEQRSEKINHKNIKRSPIGLQQVLSVGLILRTIRYFQKKVGLFLDSIDATLKSNAASFNSFSKSAMEKVMAGRLPWLANGTG